MFSVLLGALHLVFTNLFSLLLLLGFVLLFSGFSWVVVCCLLVWVGVG